MSAPRIVCRLDGRIHRIPRALQQALGARTGDQLPLTAGGLPTDGSRLVRVGDAAAVACADGEWIVVTLIDGPTSLGTPLPPNALIAAAAPMDDLALFDLDGRPITAAGSLANGDLLARAEVVVKDSLVELKDGPAAIRVAGDEPSFAVRRAAGPLGDYVVARPVARLDDPLLSERLEETERRYHAVLDTFPQPFALLDGDGLVIDINAAALTAMGAARADVVGRSVSDFTTTGRYADGEAIPGDRSPVTRVLNGEAVATELLRYLQPDGTTHWYRATVAACTLAKGARGAALSLQNVTDLIETSRTLDLSTRVQRTALEQLVDGLVVVDDERHIIQANKRAAELLGGLPSELMLAAPSRIVDRSGEPLPLEQTPLQRALNGETVNGALIGFQRDDGRRIWLRENAAPVELNGGRVGAVLSFADVTTLVELTEALRTTRDFYGRVLEHLSDGVVVIDRKGVVHQVNEAARQMLRDQDLHTGATVDPARWVVLDENGAPAAWEQYPAVRALAGEPIVDELIQVRFPDEACAWLRTNCTPVELPDGRAGVSMAVQDVTTEVTARRALAASEARLRDVVNNLTEAIVVIDRDNVVRLLNRAARAVAAIGGGIEIGDTLTGRWAVQRLDGEPNAPLTWEPALRGETVTGSVKRVAFGGTDLWLRENAAPITLDDGTPGVVLSYTNVTAQLEAQHALEASEAQFRAVFNASVDGLMVIDDGGDVIYANEVAAAIAGGTLDEVLTPGTKAWRIPDFFDAHGRPCPWTEQPVLRAQRGERVVGEVLGFDHRDGRRVWMRVNCYQCEVADGRRVVVGSFTDISAEMAGRTLLAEQEAQWRSVVNNAADGILILDAEGTVIWANQVAYGMMFMSPDARTGESITRGRMPVVIDLHGEVIPLERRAVVRALAGETVMDDVGGFPREDGTVTWARFNCTPCDLPGRARGIAVAITDITVEVEARVAVSRQEAQWRSVFANAADGILVLAADGTLVYANAAAREASFMSPATRPGLHVLAGEQPPVVDRDGRPLTRAEQPVARALAGERVAEVVVGVDRAVGERHWFRFNCTPCDLADGNAGITVAFTDITDEVRAREQVVRQEAQWRSVFENTSDAIIVYDGDGVLVHANAVAARAFRGLAPSAAIGRSAFAPDRPMFCHEDGSPVSDEERPLVRALAGDMVTGQTFGVLQDGEAVAWIRCSANRCVLSDGGDGIAIVITDITEERRVLAALADSERRFRSMIGTLPNPVVLYRPVLDDGDLVGLRVDYTNDRAGAALDAATVSELLVPAARQARATGTDTTVDLDEPAGWQAVVSATGEQILCVFTDLSEERRERGELLHRATHWPDTGLPNRAELDRSLTELVQQRRGTSFALLLLELPGLDTVRRSFGYRHAEALVSEVALRCERWAGEAGADAVAQLSTATFAVVVSRIARVRDAERLAAELLDAVDDTVLIDGVPLLVDRAVGVVLGPLHGDQPEPLVRRAKVAVSIAIDRGSDIQVWEPGIDHGVADQLTLVGSLAEGLDNGQVGCEYQPRIDLATGEVIAFDVVPYWQHPERGRIPSRVFLPLLAAGPLLAPYLSTVLHTALDDHHTLRTAAPVRVAVPFPHQALVVTSGRGLVADELIAAGCGADALELVVSERGIGAWAGPVAEAISGFGDMGVVVSLSDFCAGTTPVTYLHKLAVSAVSLDRSLVRGLRSSAYQQAVVSSAAVVAHAAGRKLGATGVETAEDLEAVRVAGCDWAQGFFFSRPVSATDLVTKGWQAPSRPERRPRSPR